MKKINNQLPNRIVAARFSHITQHYQHNKFVMPTQIGDSIYSYNDSTHYN